jgi:hypothetical protein
VMAAETLNPLGCMEANKNRLTRCGKVAKLSETFCVLAPLEESICEPLL